MKLSKQTLLKLKNKSKFLKSNKYNKLKRKICKGQIKGTNLRPRLSIAKSNEQLYVQIIDDISSKTLASQSTRNRPVLLKTKNGRTCSASQLLGKELAKICLEKEITTIIFDRGPYLYHGRIKALADSVRNNGLQF